jgi:hypothetical protein
MPLAHAFRATLAPAATIALQLVLAIVFYAVVSPLALLLRALGIDVLGARRDERAASYWRARSRSRARAGPATRATPGRT